MSTEEMLAQLIEQLSKPALPASIDLWDTEAIARYLKRSYNTVRDSILPLPSFPAPVRLPSAGRSHALYKAREVIAWAEGHQVKRA